MLPQEVCPKCQKPLSPSADPQLGLCVCDQLKSLPTKLHVLILQHPQEPDKDLGTARLAHLSLPNSTLKVGLSWPNLKAAIGREAQNTRWGVLYLGSGIKGEKKDRSAAIQFVDKKGAVTGAPEQPLEGIVILDGTWSQAKALWWRNAWLLKLRRLILQPKQGSLYKELRREPKRDCLSTLESIGETLTALGEPPSVQLELQKVFQVLLDRHRAQLKARPKDQRK